MSVLRDATGKHSMARLVVTIAIGLGTVMVVGEAMKWLTPSEQGYGFLTKMVEWGCGWAAASSTASNMRKST